MSRRQILLLAGVGIALAAAVGFGLGRISGTPKPATTAAMTAGRKPLYWYDPMVPAQHFDKPGKSPFMEMQLTPKYADEGFVGAGVHVDPAKVANLGVRLATVRRGRLPIGITATAVVDFNGRDVAVVQTRAAGFVQRVYARAPGDVVGVDAPLADLLIPEWAGAQGEYLAVRRTGDAALIRAARDRLRLIGMSPALIANVERSGRVRSVVTLSTPTGGVIKTLGVRTGMAVTAGQTLAEVNGLSRVWLNAAVPEALADEVRPGQVATASLAAYPGETFSGPVTAILPQTETMSRTLTVRIELANRGGRLRPGMFGTVQFGAAPRAALLVPSEAVIRTGRRALVMVAQPGGRYLPAEVKIGREAGAQTEILAGLSEGENIVASGQFLLDSEANLSGVEARPVTAPTQPATPQGLFEGVGRIEAIEPDSVTISHGPIPTVPWPAMTMQFKLAKPALAQGVKVGDRVAFAFDHPESTATVRRMNPAAGR